MLVKQVVYLQLEYIKLHITMTFKFILIIVEAHLSSLVIYHLTSHFW